MRYTFYIFISESGFIYCNAILGDFVQSTYWKIELNRLHREIIPPDIVP